MDRDNRWERIEKAYRAIIEGSGFKKKKYLSAISESYEKHITDEFLNQLISMVIKELKMEMDSSLQIIEPIE